MPNNVPKVGRRSTPGIYLHGSVSVLTIVEQIYKPKMAKDWTNFKAEFAARSQQPGCHKQAPTILKEYREREKGTKFCASSESGPPRSIKCIIR